MSNLHFMSFNVCLYATDLNLYLKYLRKETRILYISCKVDYLSNLSLRSCTRAKDVPSVFLCLLIHNALIMLLLENKT